MPRRSRIADHPDLGTRLKIRRIGGEPDIRTETPATLKGHTLADRYELRAVDITLNRGRRWWLSAIDPHPDDVAEVSAPPRYYEDACIEIIDKWAQLNGYAVERHADYPVVYTRNTEATDGHAV